MASEMPSMHDQHQEQHQHHQHQQQQQQQQQHVSPYGPLTTQQGNPQSYGLPQPDPSQLQHGHDGMPNPYPQYSYNIHPNYPQEASRQYPPPPAPNNQGVQLPPMAIPGQGQDNGEYSQQGVGIDTTGQIAPPGVKPRVTATLWEDEKTLCFQVDVAGTCVARREDNHMINGTKLLNVAGMTRGRRDGILKSEKQKHVVKIGPMHLKGVWIPFDRALEFANKENIISILYPLFVHNISALLYHPINRGHPSAAQIPRNQESIAYPQSMHNGEGIGSPQSMDGMSPMPIGSGQHRYDYENMPGV